MTGRTLQDLRSQVAGAIRLCAFSNSAAGPLRRPVLEVRKLLIYLLLLLCPAVASAQTGCVGGNNQDLQVKSGTGCIPLSMNDSGSSINVGVNASFKGPNPSYDILQYGGYIGPNISGTTGRITGGTAKLTVASAMDFANGQG